MKKDAPLKRRSISHHKILRTQKCNDGDKRFLILAPFLLIYFMRYFLGLQSNHHHQCQGHPGPQTDFHQ